MSAYELELLSTLNLSWRANHAQILALDDTHSVVWGLTFDTTALSRPCYAVVVEHSDPRAPVLGSRVAVFETSDDPPPFGWSSPPTGVSAVLAPDGASIVFGWSGTTGIGGNLFTRVLTWNGAMGLTQQTIVSLRSGLGFALDPGVGAEMPRMVVLSMTRALVFLTGGDGRGLFAFSSTGFGTCLYADTSYSVGVFSGTDYNARELFRLNNTQALLARAGSSGPDTAVITPFSFIDIGDDTIIQASVDFAAVNLQGLRRETTNPSRFRGYGSVGFGDPAVREYDMTPGMGPEGTDGVADTPITDTGWTEITGTMVVPAGAHYAQLTLRTNPTGAFSSLGGTVRWDDAFFGVNGSGINLIPTDESSFPIGAGGYEGIEARIRWNSDGHSAAGCMEVEPFSLTNVRAILSLLLPVTPGATMLADAWAKSVSSSPFVPSVQIDVQWLADAPSVTLVSTVSLSAEATQITDDVDGIIDIGVDGADRVAVGLTQANFFSNARYGIPIDFGDGGVDAAHAPIVSMNYGGASVPAWGWARSLSHLSDYDGLAFTLVVSDAPDKFTLGQLRVWAMRPIPPPPTPVASTPKLQWGWGMGGVVAPVVPPISYDQFLAGASSAGGPLGNRIDLSLTFLNDGDLIYAAFMQDNLGGAIAVDTGDWLTLDALDLGHGVAMWTGYRFWHTGDSIALTPLYTTGEAFIVAIQLSGIDETVAPAWAHRAIPASENPAATPFVIPPTGASEIFCAAAMRYGHIGTGNGWRHSDVFDAVNQGDSTGGNVAHAGKVVVNGYTIPGGFGPYHYRPDIPILSDSQAFAFAAVFTGLL